MMGSVRFTLVGLVQCQEESMETQLENILPTFSCTPDDARRSITFYTHDEYRQLVGDEQYRLETDPLAIRW
jgi:hypothetical protein